MTAPVAAPGLFAPHPGRARALSMVAAATAQELRIMTRNGEQTLLAYVIPLAALIAMTTTSIGAIAAPRIQTVAPGIAALAIMSAGFSSQAIMTGFDRRYGVLRRLAATGFPTWLLLASKCVATAVVIVAQFVVIYLVAAIAFDWHPHGNPLWIAIVTALGAAAFIGLALLLGGTLRAEAVLGLANLIWLVLIGLGGVLVPLTSAPAWLRVVGELTPAGALADGLRAVATDGAAPSAGSIAVLVCWVLVGWAGTVRWFRWQ